MMNIRFDDKRKVFIVGVLALLLTLMQIVGWQISMDYGSSVHQSLFFQNIGELTTIQCIIVGVLEFALFFFVLYIGFSWADRRADSAVAGSEKRRSWIVYWIFLMAIWLIFLWGCYPGFYNYDMGNQLPMVMYEEVPYDAHHPLLHTLFGGGLITLGYYLWDTNISFGVFLYNVVQMFLCAGCLSYSLGYIQQKTKSRIIVIVSFIFYAICPPIVMFAMSTTKDIMCYCALVVAVLNMLTFYEEAEENRVKWPRLLWIGAMLAVAASIRKNIIYAIVVFAVFSLVVMKKERKKQILLFVGVVVAYFVINNGLEYAFDAKPGSANEALCVPYQQIARLYNEEGEGAFTEEEFKLLSELVPPKSLVYYDPVMGDFTKANFFAGFDTLMENKWTYFKLWLKKGIEYPQIYLESILYNTYQAWYPGTQITELRGVRYFDVTDWQYKYGAPHWQGLFTFYEKIREGEYIKWPVVRLLFVSGTMMWGALITWFYGIWRNNKSVILAYLLVLLTCATTFLGPVSDIRYYLQLFYLFPVGIGIIFSVKKDGN